MQALIENLILNDLKGKRRFCVSGPEFFQTQMGRRFYECDVPEINRSLAKIAKHLEILTTGKEQREQQNESVELTALGEKILSIVNYVDETRQAWDHSYKGQGAVPYTEAKSVMAILIRLLRKP